MFDNCPLRFRKKPVRLVYNDTSDQLGQDIRRVGRLSVCLTQDSTTSAR